MEQDDKGGIQQHRQPDPAEQFPPGESGVCRTMQQEENSQWLLETPGAWQRRELFEPATDLFERAGRVGAEAALWTGAGHRQALQIVPACEADARIQGQVLR